MIRTKFVKTCDCTYSGTRYERNIHNESLRLQFLMKEIYIDILKKFV